MAFWFRRQSRPPRRYVDDQVGIYADEQGNLRTINGRDAGLTG